jgi:hypothetical protein
MRDTGRMAQDELDEIRARILGVLDGLSLAVDESNQAFHDAFGSAEASVPASVGIAINQSKAAIDAVTVVAGICGDLLRRVAQLEGGH